MIEAIRKWLLTCPLLEGQRLNVNNLGGDVLEFAIIEAPTTPILTQYLDGSSIRQKAFAVGSIQDYSTDILQQIANSGFWEKFTAWVEEQNRLRNYPALDSGCIPRKIEVTSTHYLLQTTASTGRYQVQMTLTYYQKGDR